MKKKSCHSWASTLASNLEENFAHKAVHELVGHGVNDDEEDDGGDEGVLPLLCAGNVGMLGASLAVALALLLLLNGLLLGGLYNLLLNGLTAEHGELGHLKTFLLLSVHGFNHLHILKGVHTVGLCFIVYL